MGLNLSTATQVARTFQEQALDATSDSEVETLVQGFKAEVTKLAGSSELSPSDMTALKNGFASLGLEASTVESSPGLSSAFHALTQEKGFGALADGAAFQQASLSFGFKMQQDSVDLSSPAPLAPIDLSEEVSTLSAVLDPGREFSVAEWDALTSVRAFGHEQFGGEASDELFGEEDPRLLSCACFSWALSGASDALVDPAPVFHMLGNVGIMKDVATHTADIEPGPTATWLAQEGVQDAIESIREDLVMLDCTQDEAIERVTKLMVEANGMEVVSAEESDFAICMEYQVTDPESVNFTHWGTQFGDQTLETNPGVGFWKTDDNFANNWTEHDGSTRVVTIPVKAFLPAHRAIMRDVIKYDPDA